METMWLAANYLADRVRSRLRVALGENPDRGALSLEWIVIAVLLVAAAGVAAGIFTLAIKSEATKLP